MKQKKAPLRLCVSCNQMKEKKELIRIVKSEDGINLDVTGKKNGRGAYICKSGDCIELLKKRGSLERSFKCSVSQKIYDNLIEEIKLIDK